MPAASKTLVGRSQAMEDLRQEIKLAARTVDPVLIVGESGTGKELVARAIHESGPRQDRPFLALNCSGLDEGRADAELFGSVRGAFTDVTDRPGIFEKATGGTVFLDEIGELPMSCQAKLLRTMQDGEIRRIGDPTAKNVNIRIIAATNADVTAMVERGRFRIDLRYRFSEPILTPPPLRDRLDDLPDLVAHFIGEVRTEPGRNENVSGYDGTVIQHLAAYHWPGNVRELRAAVARAVTRCAQERSRLTAADFPLPQRSQLAGTEAAGRHLREIAEHVIDDIEAGRRPPGSLKAIAKSLPELDFILHLAEAFRARQWPDADEAARKLFGYADADTVHGSRRRRK